jgi:pimeloyl-ACP methyl ester carboxylesterase
MTTLMLILVLNLGAVLAVEVAPEQVLTVISAGSGDPVVLLPGLSGCAYGYRNIVSPLQEAGYRTVIIEPLGIGSSSRPAQADYTLTAQADRVAAAMDAQGVARATVVGHGVSASVALRLAYRRPDLVAAVVSIAGGLNDTAGTPTMKKSLKAAKVVVKLGGGRLVRDKFKGSLEKASGDRSWIDRRTVGRYLRSFDKDMGACISAFRSMAEAVDIEPLRDNLYRINCPVLLLNGQAPHAGAVSDGDIETMRARLSRFSFQPVPEAGHFIFEEQPEVVVEAIKSMKTEGGRLACAP